ncbi:MAG TPA: 3-deoxy-D-manno-octulosonate 8-phosphate phosphatase, partial [Anseongella sp.]|nr:3-deoxy-D-manno-octulosonate 8-phosphate phosphatase [Anseongella sp.]
IFTGVSDKAGTFISYLSRKGTDAGQALYMGDDIPDYGPMKLAGLPVCPSDAVAEIREISLYISPFGGGKGCVRDVIEKVLKVQDKWI